MLNHKWLSTILGIHSQTYHYAIICWSLQSHGGDFLCKHEDLVNASVILSKHEDLVITHSCVLPDGFGTSPEVCHSFAGTPFGYTSHVNSHWNITLCHTLLTKRWIVNTRFRLVRPGQMPPQHQIFCFLCCLPWPFNSKTYLFVSFPLLLQK